MHFQIEWASEREKWLSPVNRPCDLFLSSCLPLLFLPFYLHTPLNVMLFHLEATLSIAFAWLHFLHQTLEAILWCDTWHKWQKSVSKMQPLSNTHHCHHSSSSDHFKLRLATKIIYTATLLFSLLYPQTSLHLIIDHVFVSIYTLLMIVI